MKEFDSDLLGKKKFSPSNVVARYRFMDLDNDRLLDDMHVVKSAKENNYFLHIRYLIEGDRDVIRSYEYDNLEVDMNLEFIEALVDTEIPKQKPIVETVTLENNVFDIVGVVDRKNRMHEIMLSRSYDFDNDFFIKLVKSIAYCKEESELVIVSEEMGDEGTVYYCVRKEESFVRFVVVS